jgi:hypothetical protein
MTECDFLTDQRAREYCRGERGTVEVCNHMRAGWGLPPLPDGWDVSMPSRGLGDVVAKITHATGIDRVVKAVTGGGCGCEERQAALNAAIPFKGTTE